MRARREGSAVHVEMTADEARALVGPDAVAAAAVAERLGVALACATRSTAPPPSPRPWPLSWGEPQHADD